MAQQLEYDGSTPLKGRQERFADLYSDGNVCQSDAYRMAGYKATNEESVWVNACQLIRKDKVNARIRYLQAEKAKKLAITREGQALKLEKAQTEAWKREDIATYGRLVETQSRHFGLLTDVVRDERQQQALSDARREELAEQARKAANAPKVIKLTG